MVLLILRNYVQARIRPYARQTLYVCTGMADLGPPNKLELTDNFVRSPCRHARESGHPEGFGSWIPACAGMTRLPS
jgi:hypothetical protein